MLENWGIYDVLKSKKNIVFDVYERNNELLLDKDQHYHKCERINSSMAVIHAGTTIGLEASYFDVPVVYLNIQDLDYGISMDDSSHVFHSWNQYHLQKYFNLEGTKFVVKSVDDLRSILVAIVDKKIDQLSYNEKLRTYSSLLNIEEFTERFVDLIEQCLNGIIQHAVAEQLIIADLEQNNI